MADAYDDPRVTAGVAMIGRTGAEAFTIQFVEAADDEPDKDFPVVWIAQARWSKPVRGFKVGTGYTPVEAVMTLCEDIVDGGVCTHCKRPSGFDPESVPVKMPGDKVFCWYQFDLATSKFVRACQRDGVKK